MKKKQNKRIVFFLFIIFLTLPAYLGAADFGLVLSGNGGYGNRGSISNADGEDAFDYEFDILPRFSFLIGNSGEFILSAGFSFKMENEEISYVPELLRTELTLRFGASNNMGIRAGRFNFSDPLSLIADGLFDGIQIFHNSNFGYFRIGAWYTGLLYKKNINITMTAYDELNYNTPFDYDNFSDTYFAPKRAFASIGWEHPSIGEILHLNTAIIGQMDLSDADIKRNNQYIVIKAGIPVNNLLFELGGSAEISQSVTDEETNNGLSYAGELGLFLLFPGEFNSTLSLKGIITAGKIEDTCEAFVPITTKYYGNIFQQKMSALSVLSLNYSTRINQAFGVSAAALYFIRNDLGTYVSYPVNLTDGNDGYFLGPEISARLVWSPASDLQINLGGGVFIPALGDAGPDTQMQWRVELGAVMSIY